MLRFCFSRSVFLHGLSLARKAKSLLSFLPETDADFRTTQGSLPFASLNQACFSDAAVITVADGVQVEKPVQVRERAATAAVASLGEVREAVVLCVCRGGNRKADSVKRGQRWRRRVG